MMAKLGRGILKFLIVALLVVDLYPIIWLILSSFKREAEFIKPMYMLPEGLHWQNYSVAISQAHLGTLFKNTMIVTCTSIVFVWLLSSTAAFAVTKMKWKWSRLALNYITMGMFIPAFVLLLPQFLLLQKTHLLNSLAGLIVIFISTSIPMSFYLLTGFYKYLPDEILEAAVMDGCDIYRCFVRIAIPLSLNGAVTVVMLAFVNIWNDLLISQTFVSSNTNKMLQVGLASFIDDRGNRDWGPTFATICAAIVPTLALYLILNRKIIDGLSAGAVKG